LKKRLSNWSGARSERRRSVPRNTQRPGSGTWTLARPSASVRRQMPSGLMSPRSSTA
jgi:hypothetical protein